MRYIFIATTGSWQDITLVGESGFQVAPSVAEAKLTYLNAIVNFLNGNGQPTGLYFCSGLSCNVDNQGAEGHFHVIFGGDSCNNGPEVLRRFLPNYNCEEVRSIPGINNFYRQQERRFIGGIRGYVHQP